MATNTNTTVVHIFLILFVMISIVLGVVAYIQTGEATDNAAVADKAEDDRKALDTKWNDAQDKLDALKKKGGFPGNVLLKDSSDKNYLTQMNKKFEEWLGPEDTRPNNLSDVGDILSNNLSTKDKSLIDIEKLHNSEKALRGKQEKDFLTKLDNLDKKLKEETAAHLKTITEIKEKLDQKDVIIAERTDEKNSLVTKIDTLTNSYQQEVKNLTQRNTTLQTTVQRQTLLLAAMNQHSFEIADGEILAVNYQLGLVWINLGKADGLPERGTFSVYSRSNNGIGRGDKIDPNNPNGKSQWKRGPQDIKGAIEITRIIGPHKAEARILVDEGDFYNPLATGDLIYSPSYTPGQINSFAFVGIFDINNDGSPDTAALKAEVFRNGGRMSSFVDESVTREYAKNRTAVSVQDKFLVLGAKPDYTKSRPDQKEAHKRLLEEYSKMIQEAQESGVRIIRMNDFLAYMGIKPIQRLWRPGEGKIRVLKSGSKSQGIGGTSDRTASGVVSALYSKHKRLKLNRSSGNVSGLYKSGGK